MQSLILVVAVLLGLPAHSDTTALPEQIFQGVRLLRRIETEPDPLVVHLVEIDLDASGIRFATTPSNGPDNARETWCETTRQFVERVGAQLGINGSYFIHDKEDHTELLGLAASEGDIVSPWDTTWARFAVNIDQDNRVTFVERPEDGAGSANTNPAVNVYNALSGSPMLLRHGQVLPEPGGERHPRTGIGLRQDNTLLLLIVDGRQPDRSVGMTFHEMALCFKEYGATIALALDGGGSTTLVIANPTPRVVNAPMPGPLPGGITLGPPGIERRNGNNLAVFAAPLVCGAAEGE